MTDKIVEIVSAPVSETSVSKAGAIEVLATSTTAAQDAQVSAVVEVELSMGPQGPANDLTIGTVTDSGSGGAAAVVVRGQTPHQILDFTLPRGIQGIQGPIGMTRYLVQSGNAYPARPDPQNAVVTFVGTADPNALGVMIDGDSWLNTGANDTPLSYVPHFEGHGFPEGVVTAGVGSRYIDLDSTCGAVEWIKASGTGSTGWKLVYGDTGRRKVKDSFGNDVYFRRSNNLVSAHGIITAVTQSTMEGVTFFSFPGGFAPMSASWTHYVVRGTGMATTFSLYRKQADLALNGVPAGNVGDLRWELTFMTSDGWPTGALPGSAG